jgi:hypothetical protein
LTVEYAQSSLTPLALLLTMTAPQVIFFPLNVLAHTIFALPMGHGVRL